MTRVRRKNRAIALGLADALKVVEQVNRQGGGAKIPKSSLAPMVKSKATSSLFDRKLSALRSYGLVDVSGDEVSLTQLGRAYAVPTSPEARAETTLQAFRRVSLFESLLNRYNGSPLPEINEFFYNMVAETYDVPVNEAPKWVMEFIYGARHAGVLIAEAGQEIVLLLSPVGTPSTDAEGENDMGTVVAEQQIGGVEVVDVRILGGKMRLSLPDEIAPSLLRKSIAAMKDALTIVENRLKRAEEEGGPSEES